MSEGIHFSSGTPIPLKHLELLNEGEPIPSWKPPEAFNTLYEQALTRMIEKVRIRAIHLEKQLWEELKHSGIRLEEYYRHQIQDIPNKDFLVQDRKIAELESECQRQMNLLVEKHQLKVSIQLLGYLVLRVPHQQFQFQFAQGAFHFHYNRFSGEWDPIFCQKCRQSRETKYFFSEKGELFCPNCGIACPVCKSLTSTLPICSICANPSCERCLTPCFQCRQNLCISDQKECVFCEHKICPKCSFQCMLCLSSGCKIHSFEFDSHLYCEKCLFVCKQCLRNVPKSNKKNCPVCGQHFCEFCFQKCSRCANEYCGIHSECNSCGEKK